MRESKKRAYDKAIQDLVTQHEEKVRLLLDVHLEELDRDVRKTKMKFKMTEQYDDASACGDAVLDARKTGIDSRPPSYENDSDDEGISFDGDGDDGDDGDDDDDIEGFIGGTGEISSGGQVVNFRSIATSKLKRTKSHYVREEDFTNAIDQMHQKLRGSVGEVVQEELQKLSTLNPAQFSSLSSSLPTPFADTLNDSYLGCRDQMNQDLQDSHAGKNGHNHGDQERGLFRMSNIIGDRFDMKLDEDTFTMMMLSKSNSKSWLVGGSSFTFQISLGLMILLDQLDDPEHNNLLDVPFQVDSVVYAAQVLSLTLVLSTQTDILTSTRSLILMGKGSNWDIVIGEQGNGSIYLWIIRIGIPNIMKFTQGVLVVLISMIIIVQADNIIDLLQDFTALMIISEVDNIIFQLAAYGYLGEGLRKETEKVRNKKITCPGMDRRIRYGIVFVRIIFFTLLATMFGAWSYVYINQKNGVFFGREFEGCDQYKLVEKFGDDLCYGGPLNNLACEFEFGDCVNFNLAYPNCKGDNLKHLINVEKMMSNDKCDTDFAIPECEYDAGECCPYSIQGRDSFGDDICNGGKISSSLCGFDNGDCLAFSREYPNCLLDELAEKVGNESIILGDGICDSSLYASEACGYEYKDCDIGQIGQDVVFGGISSGKALSFRFEASTDASTIILGKYNTDRNGNYNDTSPGFVSVLKYNANQKKWSEDTLFEGDNIGFGLGVGLSGNGNIIAGGSPFDGFHYVKVFNYVQEQSQWRQFGQVLLGGDSFGNQIDMTDDGLRMAISTPYARHSGVRNLGLIQVFEMDSSEQQWVQVGNDIYGQKSLDLLSYWSFKLSPKDGTRVFFSRGYDIGVTVVVYEFNQTSVEWNQVGNELVYLYPVRKTKFAINADGSRIAVSSHSNNPDRNGSVTVYDLKTKEDNVKVWSEISTLSLLTSTPVVGDGDGFGYSTSFSHDGNLLAVSTVKPACDGNPQFCPTGSVSLYRYSETHNPRALFALLPLKRVGGYGNVVQEMERRIDGDIVGIHVSLSGDGAELSISGFDLESNDGFVKVYQLDELFYPECVVPDPEKVGNGGCNPVAPYYTQACSFDGGDCTEPQQHPSLPNCFVFKTSSVGDESCDDHIPYNTIECNFDGGDCPDHQPADGYPNCLVSFPDNIKDGECFEHTPYNGYDCGFDGGDCSILD